MEVINLNRLLNAITEALRNMGTHPLDDVQTIWNESLSSWATGLRMDHNYEIDVDHDN